MGKIFKLSSIFVVMLVGMLIMAACGGAPPPQSGSSGTPSSSGSPSSSTQTVTIPSGKDLFTPFIVVIKSGQTVTWNNQNSSSYTVTTTPEKSSYLNPQAFKLTIPANKTATHTFSMPGVYHYYETTKDTWNSSYNQIAANKGISNYPLSMSGVILVQGSISGLPSSATVTVKKGVDLFQPYIIGVNTGGTVNWKNYDSMEHTVVPVPGYSSPINPQATAVQVLNPSSNPGSTATTKSITYDAPGLYYYYCSIHATVNSTYNRASALTVALQYPIPMAGFVYVG